MDWIAALSARVVDFIQTLSLEQAFVVVGAIWATVTIITEMSNWSWGRFRIVGVPRWVFHFVIGVGILLIVVEMSGAIAPVLLGIHNMTLVTQWLGGGILVLAVLYLLSELFGRSSFKPLAFIGLLTPLSPLGGAYVLAGKAGLLVHLLQMGRAYL
ncbi:MAG: hypothetical protein WB760_01320 [Xanthobacteraceae bacterium]